jgi:hypothetical protein
MKKEQKYWTGTILALIMIVSACTREETPDPPFIELVSGTEMTTDSAVLMTGQAIRFHIRATAIEEPLTNLTIKMWYNGTSRSMLDTGIYENSFSWKKVFYQGIEDTAYWEITVMDKNRLKNSTGIMIFKDPDSQFSAIRYYSPVTLGFQQNTETGHFFDTRNGRVFDSDSAQLFQNLIDVLCYFKYSEDNGVNLPSPTFSSPGESANPGDELYALFYPELTGWETRNYTKWDIRADNGISESDFNSAWNDSLLIVSYDDVWGKKKYKWALPGLFIPFQTSLGRKGIVHIIDADMIESGSITFEMKVQY